MVGFGWQPKQSGKDRFQTVRPHRAAFDGGMQFVARVHHSVKQPAILVGQLVVHIQKANLFPVGKPREFVVDFVNGGDHGHVVVAWKLVAVPAD